MSVPINDGPRGDFPGGGGTIPVFITTSTLPSGNQGTTYFQYLNANGGYPPYNWSLVSGTLPIGLSLDGSGFISGTPTTVGTSTFTVLVTDQIGGINTKTLSIQINASSDPTIVTSTLPTVIVGSAYNQTLIATGGTTPYTNWTINSGTLPTGLTLNSSGVISGTPTVAGIYSFGVQVIDSASHTGTKIFSISVQTAAPNILTTSLESGVTGSSYSTILYATGGSTPYTSWQVTAGSLPTGLLISGTPTTATISGVPTASGTFTFTVTLTDSAATTDSQVLSITIFDGNIPTISTTELDFAPLNVFYSAPVFASGGSLPYTWSIASGDLPVGLSLDPDSGIISGTPTNSGSYIFTIKVTDHAGRTDTQLLSLIVGNFFLPSITTDSLPNGIEDVAYFTYVQAAGGILPYTWGIIGTLPPGLSIDSTTGQISGIPTTAGSYTFNVLLQDTDGHIDVEGFSIQIGETGTPIITTTSLDNAELGVNYLITLNAIGGIPSYTWTNLIGTLPPGLSLSSTGIISGIPTEIGFYNFTVQIKDSANATDSQNYRLIVTSRGYSSNCCFCVFTGDIVNFTTNSSTGVLTSSGGTVLSNSQWQAPAVEGNYNITITADGVNGQIQVKNTISVVRKLELVDSPYVIDYLLPGDKMTLKTNYPIGDVIWETLNHETPIITPDGNLVINTSVADKCFGSLDVTVRGRLEIVGVCSTLESYIDVQVVVKPVYPTPDNCGPEILKWLRETKDFRVLITEFEGGCDETHIRNSVPIVKWTVNYDGLVNYSTSSDFCSLHSNSNKVCGCNNLEEINVLPGCHPILKSSNRLDDFWNLVYGQYKRFTLVDHDTGEIWYNVRFDDQMSTDHRHRRLSGSRNIKLVWKPCCNKSPAGGTCSQHGISNYSPTRIPSSCMSNPPIVPTILSITSDCDSPATVVWSKDTLCGDYPVKGYELKVDDTVYIITNENITTIEGLVTNEIHSFSIRSYDVTNNYSTWSIPIKVKLITAYDYIVENGDYVIENGIKLVDYVGCKDNNEIEIPEDAPSDSLVYYGEYLIFDEDYLTYDT